MLFFSHSLSLGDRERLHLKKEKRKADERIFLFTKGATL